MPAEFCRRQRFLADAGVAVRGDDQIGIGRDFRGRRPVWVGLHDDLDSASLAAAANRSSPSCNDDPGDIDAVLPQHVECRHAEMAGADQGDPHECCPWLVRPICR